MYSISGPICSLILSVVLLTDSIYLSKFLSKDRIVPSEFKEIGISRTTLGNLPIKFNLFLLFLLKCILLS